MNAQGEMWGSVVGAGGTAAAAFLSDRRLKEDITKVGYDAETGVVHQPDALPEAEIHGCGGATCS